MDPAFMTKEQLLDRRLEQDDYQKRVLRKKEELRKNEMEAGFIIDDNFKLILPYLQGLAAEEYDDDIGFALHKDLKWIFEQAAKYQIG